VSGLELAILGLAVWRLSHMVSSEAGPGDCFAWLRRKAGIECAANGLGCRADHFWGKLLGCPLCLSVWMAAIGYAGLVALPVLWPVAVILAVSGASCLLELVVRRT